MNSIRRSLTIRVLARIVPLVILGSITVYLSVRMVVLREFDSALRHEMQVLAAAAERVEGVGVDFDYRPEEQKTAMIDSGLDFAFDARLADGSLLKQTPALKGGRLDLEPLRRDDFVIGRITLPDGTTARGCGYEFEPRTVPASEHPGPMDRPDAPLGPVRIVIAASTRDIDRLLAALAGTEALVGAALLAATTIALGISVREGLKPVESLAQQVTSIEPSDLSARLALPGRPVELAPIVSRLNELLLRVDQAFSREKSFTSNAAHELRTPIAEIRTIAEVAAGADDEERRRSLREIAEISCEMQETISTLLLMARAKAGTLGVERQEMNLSALLEECCDRREEAAAGRLERTIEPDLTLRSDASILALIIGNLIDNALTYATAGTPIGVRAFREAGQTRVEIENRSEGLTESDMIRLFEPFWRSRAATVTGTHSGLGLALVKALTEAVGGDVGASLDGSGSLRMSLRIPPGSGI